MATKKLGRPPFIGKIHRTIITVNEDNYEQLLSILPENVSFSQWVRNCMVTHIIENANASHN